MNEFLAPASGFPPPADTRAAASFVADFAAIGAAARRFADAAPGRALLDCLGGNAPHLANLALRESDIPPRVLAEGAGPVMDEALALLREADPLATRAAIGRILREVKRRAALAIALADLSGAWGVEQVTAALSDLADASIGLALRHLLRHLHERGTISLPDPADPERASRFAVLGMGKLGARELNYSSDIDLVLLFDPSSSVYRDDSQSAMARLARDLVPLLTERDADGMVFRVDLRLRPDPAATPPVVSLAAALSYYESQGRTWERAAFSKARPVAGDRDFGASFLEQIRPFIWRRNLDFAAVAEIHEMKRRIDQRRRDAPGRIAGRDVKLGRGGIREIEFIVQTLELVWGGHEPALRIPATLPALRALAAAGHLPRAAARDLAAAYRALRQVEHRLQMVEDRQTHTLPETEAGLARFATFMNMPDAARFAAWLDAVCETVNAIFADFFDTDPGSGKDGAPDPGESGAAPDAFAGQAQSLGFADPQHLAVRLRLWRNGTLPALRTARARELLDSIMPALLRALGRQTDPDLAFRRFDRMLERQSAGVSLLSLFQHNPALLDRLATVLGAAPPLADHLASNPGALDALLAPVARFTRPGPALRRLLRDAADLETALDTLRRFVRREEFHLAVATLERRISADQASLWRTDLADAALAALLPRVMADFAARHGRVRGGRFAIVALGRVGAREMQPGSDLDLMLIYDHPPEAAAARLPPSQYFLRLAHALVAAITAPGAEGAIYAVDMRLRPSGNKGPVAVSLAAFRRYHAEEAWTWERLALTRARVLAATRGFAPVVDAEIRAALARDIPPATTCADTVAMRARLARDAPPAGPFDLKHRAGGMMELGFIAEALQLVHFRGAPSRFRQRTAEALAELEACGALDPAEAGALAAADRWYRAVQAMRRITGLADPRPDSPKSALAPILAAAGALDFDGIIATMEAQAAVVRTSFVRHLGDPRGITNPRGDTA
ncbi:bifunctional [glutamine synthetase] adenylyltransferase/[glutamine synthetase]-adenylyl-L-tyrosine phosphorylase [Acidiphilium sp.]|uniref:bifunctional [glutamine synthetase] adenylyltransferase/[glutamine synthetase]-adenylyl-L-tyrosine phosphorylase n=1 Tax=Acidiphilium sp. TaxID=527 RepID=UPI00258F1F1A|nr:bifunctional [glutamine synthetase] adenylyltransferase/[glutamine synthetase]-adenylyl-L-tyrosine phosphorylase [Acidiphilium sp.]